MRRLAICLLVAVGCGGTRSPRGGSGGDPQQVGPGGHSSDPVDPEAPVSADECRKLTDHVIDLYLAKQRRELPPERVPTEEQVTEIRAKLGDELGGQCLEHPRAFVDCAMAAETYAATKCCVPEATCAAEAGDAGAPP